LYTNSKIFFQIVVYNVFSQIVNFGDESRRLGVKHTACHHTYQKVNRQKFGTNWKTVNRIIKKCSLLDDKQMI